MSKAMHRAPEKSAPKLERKTRRISGFNEVGDRKHFFGINAIEKCLLWENSGDNSEQIDSIPKELSVILKAIDKIQRESPDSDDVWVLNMAKTLRSLGNMFFMKGNLNGAFHAYTKELGVRELRQKSWDNAIIETLEKICFVHLCRCDWLGLVENMKQLLKLKKLALGERHIETSIVMQRIGDAYRLSGQNDVALGFYTDSLAVTSLNLRSDCPTLLRIGDIHFLSLSYDEAYEAYTEALNLTNDERIMCSLFHRIGLICFSKGEYDEAEINLDKALELKRKIGPGIEFDGMWFCDDGSCEARSDCKQRSTDLPPLSAMDTLFDDMSLPAMLLNTTAVYFKMGKTAKANICKEESDILGKTSVGLLLYRLTEKKAELQDSKEQSNQVSKKRAPLSFDPMHSATYERETKRKCSNHSVTFSKPFVTSSKEVPRISSDEKPFLFYTEQDFTKFRKDKGGSRFGFSDKRRYFEYVAATLDKAGRNLQEDGDYDKALSAYTRALRVKTVSLGNEEISTAASISNIGEVYVEQGQLDKALNAFSAVVKLLKSGLSDTHLCVSTALVKVASVHSSLGNLSEAVDLYTEALRIRKMQLGPNHILLASAHEAIGVLQLQRGINEEALDHMEEALRIKTHLLGKRHEGVSCTLRNLGDIHHARGEIRNAIKSYTRALKIMERNADVFGEEITSTQINIAIVLSESEEYSRALDYLKDALRSMVDRTGRNNMEVCSVLCSIADMYRKIGDESKAAEIYKQALLISKAVLGPGDGKVRKILTDLHSCHCSSIVGSSFRQDEYEEEEI